MKSTIVPNELIGAPYYRNYLSIDSVNLVESCSHEDEALQGSMFLKDHLLLFVLEGTNKITYGKQEYVVQKNEMVLLKKNIGIRYDKTGSVESGGIYDSMMFFLKEEFIVDFIKMAGISTNKTAQLADVNVKPVQEPLLSFVSSIKGHFNAPEKVDKRLLKMKIMELLFDLVQTDKDLLLQLLQLRKQLTVDISTVMKKTI